MLAAGTFARGGTETGPEPFTADTGCCEPPVAAATGNWPAAAAPWPAEPTLPARDWLPTGTWLPTTWLPARTWLPAGT